MASTDNSWNVSALPGKASGALRLGKWKLLVGPQHQASWFGHFTPNITACGPNSSKPPGKLGGGKCPAIDMAACTTRPCLYDVQNDKTEHVDVAQSQPEALATLLQRWQAISAEYHPPPNPQTENDVYCSAIIKNRGFVAPWKQ